MGYGTPQTPITLFASAARTVTESSEVVRTPGGSGARGSYRGLLVVIDVTAVTSTPSVVFTVEGADGDGTYTTVLASAALAVTGSTLLLVHESAPTARANVISKAALGSSQWRLTATHGNANSITYSVVAFPLR